MARLWAWLSRLLRYSAIVVLLLIGGDKASQQSDVKKALQIAKQLEE